MIKKCLKVLCILGLILLPISFVSADIYTGSIPGSFDNFAFNSINDAYNHNYTINWSLSFLTDGRYNNIFYTCPGVSDAPRPRTWILFWNNGKLAGYGNQMASAGPRIYKQGYYTSYCSSYVSGFEDYCYVDATSAPNYTTSIDNFYSLGAIYDEYYFDTSVCHYPRLCLISNSEDIVSCFTFQLAEDGFNRNYFISGYDILDTISDFPSNFNSYEGDKFEFSVFSSSSYDPGHTNVSAADLDKYIEYYEVRFGRDKNMCYVGTDNFTGSYGLSGLSFNVGTGLTLNEFYYKLYGTFGSNNIKNVGSFINAWLINYTQWFYDGKMYFVDYNGPDTNISVYYDNLTFPFANKPAALYFMASNLFDTYARESTQGEEMAFYCQMKTNYQFYKANPSNFKQEVESKVSSGVVDRVQTYYNSQIVNNGTGKVGFQVPNLTGTVWGDISDGNVLPEGLNPINLFKDSFTKITNLTQSFNPSQNGILPDWIVYPLIFLVLFRIFKH